MGPAFEPEAIGAGRGMKLDDAAGEPETGPGPPEEGWGDGPDGCEGGRVMTGLLVSGAVGAGAPGPRAGAVDGAGVDTGPGAAGADDAAAPGAGASSDLARVAFFAAGRDLLLGRDVLIDFALQRIESLHGAGGTSRGGCRVLWTMGATARR